MFTCSCVATSFLKEAYVSSLNIALCLSSFFRKLLWEKDDTMVEESFITEAVAEVALESGALCLGDCLFFLLSMTGKEALLSMS